MNSIERNTKRRLVLGLACAASTLALAPAALAQTADAASGARPPTELQEVVVTAQRVGQNLEKVPVAVTALSGTDLEHRGVTNTTNLQFSAPNLNVAASPVGGNGAAQIFVRGVGQLDYVATQEPDVPIYLDGVYVARPVGSVIDFVDIDRVEVLRGPQGTLFGRNALGGAIQIISQAPTSTFGGMTEITGGSYGRRDVAAEVNLPLNDMLALRLVGSSDHDDGYAQSTVTGERENQKGDDDLRAALRWRPDSSTDVIFRAEYFRHQADPALQTLTSVTNTPILASYNSMLAAQGLPQITSAMVPSDPYKGVSGVTTPDTVSSWNTSLEATHNFSGFSVKSITAYRTVDGSAGFDFSGVPYPYLTQVTTTNEQQFSQELQIYGKSFDNRLTWIGGLFYFHEYNQQPQEVTELQDVVRTGPGLYDFAPVAGTGVEELSALNQTTNSYAAYVQATYAITGQLDATVGARESLDCKTLGSSVGLGGTYTSIRPYEVQSECWNQLTPKFGLDYRITDQIMTYVSISKGYRAGGFNGHDSSATLPNAYGPESLWDYEGGVKSEWLDHRLRVNLSGFYYDYQNYQANENVTVNGIVGVVVGNAAGVRMYGGELETQFLATEHLTLSAFGSLESIKFVDINSTTVSVLPTSQPPNAPKATAGVSAQYATSVWDWGKATLRGDYAFKSTTQFFLPNYPGEAQGAYSVVNARLTLTPNQGPYELSIFGTNITDTHYRTYAQSLAASFGTIIASYAPPAEWGASLRVKF